MCVATSSFVHKMEKKTHGTFHTNIILTYICTVNNKTFEGENFRNLLGSLIT